MLLILLTIPSIAAANPTICTIRFAQSCTLTVTQNNTYFVQFVAATPNISDTLGLTFTLIRNDSFTDSFGALHVASYYARTGTNSGNDTITVCTSAGNCGDGIVESFPSTDVKATGNPVDSTCFCNSGAATCGPIPAPGGNVNTCSVSSTGNNDIYQYFTWVSVAASCTFLLATTSNTGPTVNKYLSGSSGCNYEFVNLIQPGANNTIIPSGPPTTTLVNINFGNTSSLSAFLAAQHVLLFAGSTGGAAKRKLPPFIVNNRGRPHRRVPT